MWHVSVLHFFSWLSGNPIVRLGHVWLIRSFGDGHLGCFYHSALVPPISTCMSEYLPSAFLGIHLEVELLGQLYSYIFKEHPNFYTAAEPFYFFYQQCTRFQFLYILAKIYFSFKDYNHPDGYQVESHCGFECITLMTNDVEHPMCLLAICKSSLGKRLVRSLAQILIGLFVFSLSSCKSY